MAGSGKKKEKLRNIAQYFAIEKMQRDGSQKIQGGNRDYRVREAGGLSPPVPPPKEMGGTSNGPKIRNKISATFRHLNLLCQNAEKVVTPRGEL